MKGIMERTRHALDKIKIMALFTLIYEIQHANICTTHHRYHKMYMMCIPHVLPR